MRKTAILLACAVMALVSMTAIADQAIWQEGLNQYVKLVSEGKGVNGPAPPNQQPVTLQPEQITNALETIQIWQKNFLSADKARLVFSSGEADTLGRFLSQALAKARPDQDVIFAVVSLNRHFLGIHSRTYMAGRAFYANNTLNIIIGDFDREPDKLKEEAYGSAGLTEYRIDFLHGRRDKASRFFKNSIIATAGVTTHQGRPDWLMIDVPKAAATYAAEMQEEEQKKNGNSAADSAAIREEQARLEQQRLQLRLEMARFKKEMSETNKGKSMTIEQRLTELKELRDKKLITEAEYQAKRKQILDEM